MKKKTHFLFGMEGTDASSFFGIRKRSIRWVEESFTFDKAFGRHRPIPNSREHMGSSLRPHHIMIVLGITVIVFSIIIIKLVSVQLIQGNNYVALADNNRQRNSPIPAERGLIFDRKGIQLTKNIPKLSIALTPQGLPRDTIEREKIIRLLSTITGESTEELRALLTEYGGYSYDSILLKENISYEQALSIDIQSEKLPGISIEHGSKRLYLQDDTLEDNNMSSSSLRSLSHILGYEGKLNKDELTALRSEGYLSTDTLGKTGIEKAFESSLRGVYGVRRREVDVLEREQNVIAEEAPVPGKNLYLTIDARIQEALESALQDGLAITGKERGAAVALDPRNGEILALVSLPTYDNNDFSGGITSKKYSAYLENKNNPLFNRAIGGAYPSGSTIKPAIAAAALEENIITERTSFLSTGGLAVGQWFFPDWQAGGHGRTNVRKSIAWSVNTFYYYIGGGHKSFTGLGVNKITYYLRKFGFGDKLNINIPGEAGGFLPSKDWKQQVKSERWYIGDTYNLSIGQGDILVSPLQIAAMTGVIANKGTLYKPKIARETQDPRTGLRKPVEDVVLGESIISKRHLHVIANGMRDCVTYAACRRLAQMPIAISGKTGTAQWSNSREPHAWFTSFAPHENPEIVVTILVEEGEGGSSTAVPIAHDFYKWWGSFRLNNE